MGFPGALRASWANPSFAHLTRYMDLRPLLQSEPDPSRKDLMGTHRPKDTPSKGRIVEGKTFKGTRRLGTD
jgi:hypothetical protein